SHTSEIIQQIKDVSDFHIISITFMFSTQEHRFHTKALYILLSLVWFQFNRRRNDFNSKIEIFLGSQSE
ncbi:hypothetical protein, partial [Phocaeicola plebeius]|uniref:hypothetical protein n=1 Tax=Phocaeicola plebeius TaxID=310297 RepID=UPI003A9224DE